jgi:hypothetical protein
MAAAGGRLEVEELRTDAGGGGGLVEPAAMGCWPGCGEVDVVTGTLGGVGEEEESGLVVVMDGNSGAELYGCWAAGETAVPGMGEEATSLGGGGSGEFVEERSFLRLEVKAKFFRRELIEASMRVDEKGWGWRAMRDDKMEMKKRWERMKMTRIRRYMKQRQAEERRGGRKRGLMRRS